MFYGLIECLTTCGKCGSPAFINGPVEAIHCNACQESTDIPKDVIKTLLKAVFEGWATELWEERDGNKASVMSAINYEFTVGRRQPHCTGCKRDFTAAELADRPGTAGWSIACPDCGRAMPVTRPAGWIPEKYPQIVLFLNGETAEPSAAAEPDKPAIEGVVMACPKCGGSLEIDGRERLMPCKYCESKVYLPDDLWLRLHPVEKVQRWWLAFNELPPDWEKQRQKALSKK